MVMIFKMLFSTIVLPFYNNASVDYWVSVQHTLRLLRYIVPRELTEKAEVGIAGSSPLYWYQEMHWIGPKWNGPNDVDVFVAGYWGESDEKFTSFVDLMEERMKNAGYECQREDKWHNYACQSGPIHIADFTIKGLSKVVSFVQNPECATIQDVAKRFDISVCKVVYHIHKQTFETMHGTRRDIVHCKFDITPPKVECPGSLTNFERCKACSTLHRNSKYASRGFELANMSEMKKWVEQNFHSS
jgi:hypothetical protein